MTGTRNTPVAWTEMSLLALALLCASVYGTGFEPVRLSLGYFCIGAAALFAGLRLLAGFDRVMVSWVLVVLGLGLIYFLTRALASNVSRFAHQDGMLVATLFTMLLLGNVVGFRRALIVFLPWCLCALVFFQTLAVVMRYFELSIGGFPAPNAGDKELTGFYFHRLGFGEFLSGCILWLSGAAFMSKHKIWIRVFFGVFAALGGGLVLGSLARGPILSLVISLVVASCSLWLIRGVAQDKSIVRIAACLLITFFVVIFLLGVAAVQLLEMRNGFEVKSLATADNSRMGMLRLALDVEHDNPLIGGGARFFSYEVNRIYSTDYLRGSMGDPKFVHNEYVQAWVDYGLVGLGLMVGSVVLVLVAGIKGIFHHIKLEVGHSERLTRTMIFVTALGACLGVMIHSCVNFVLHLQGPLIMSGMALGCLAGCLGQKKGVVWGRAVGLVLLCLSGLLLFQNAKLLGGIQLERQASDGSLESARELAEWTGDFAHFALWGNRAFQEMRKLSADTNANEKELELRLNEAGEAFEATVSRHPWHPFGWINLGQVRSRQGRFAEARDCFIKARQVATGREPIFPALDFAGGNESLWAYSHWREGRYLKAAQYYAHAALLFQETKKRGRGFDHKGTEFQSHRIYLQTFGEAAKALWYAAEGKKLWGERKAPEAMAAFEAAELSFEKAAATGFDLRGASWQEARNGVREAISILKAGRIEPAECLPEVDTTVIKRNFLLN